MNINKLKIIFKIVEIFLFKFYNPLIINQIN